MNASDHTYIPNSRLKSGLITESSAFITLLAMLLIITGVDHVGSTILSIMPLYITISLVAALLGLFLCKWRIQWTALVGLCVGLLGGLAIVLNAVSNI
jgi:hypothetical protein